MAVDLDARMKDLDRSIQELSAYIDDHATGADIDIETLIKLRALHGQLISRLGRLVDVQRKHSGVSADVEVREAINDALDRLSVEWGIAL